MRRNLLLGALLALCLGSGLPQFAGAQKAKEQAGTKGVPNERPVGSLEVTAREMRLILGGSSGKGVLRFRGHTYPFTFKAGSAGSIGMKEVVASGDVYFLKKIEDFPGVYAAITTGATAGKAGIGRSWYENEKGVRVSLRAKTVEGGGFSTGITLATVELVKQ